MRGAGDALRRDRERVLYGAWATERFARQEKLLAFPHYVKSMLGQEKRGRQTPMEQLAVFETMRSAGVPMTIKLVERHRPASPASPSK